MPSYVPIKFQDTKMRKSMNKNSLNLEVGILVFGNSNYGNVRTSEMCELWKCANFGNV